MRITFAPLLAAVLMTVASLSAALPAHSQAASRTIVVLGDFSDKTRVTTENDLLLGVLRTAGGLRNVSDLAARPEVIDAAEPDGQALLARWGMTTSDLPALAVAELDGGRPSTLLWTTTVTDTSSALAGMVSWLQKAPPSLGAIRVADHEPRDPGRPLTAGKAVRITVQGEAGGSATAHIGSRSVSLFEQNPGLYQGSYTATTQDSGTADVQVSLVAPGGRSDSRTLGTLVFGGLSKPVIQSIQNVGYQEWVFFGVAPPNSAISIDTTIVMRVIFKITDKQTYHGRSDANGNFQVRARYATKTSIDGDFQVTAVDPGGARVQGDVARLTMTMNAAFEPAPPQQQFVNLEGSWFHNGRRTSIRNNGYGRVIITNEFNGETELRLEGRDRLVKGWSVFDLQGRISPDGSRIDWNNGTFWTRRR